MCHCGTFLCGWRFFCHKCRVDGMFFWQRRREKLNFIKIPVFVCMRLSYCYTDLAVYIFVCACFSRSLWKFKTWQICMWHCPFCSVLLLFVGFLRAFQSVLSQAEVINQCFSLSSSAGGLTILCCLHPCGQAAMGGGKPRWGRWMWRRWGRWTEEGCTLLFLLFFFLLFQHSNTGCLWAWTSS